jgi:hypothetical protein
LRIIGLYLVKSGGSTAVTCLRDWNIVPWNTGANVPIGKDSRRRRRQNQAQPRPSNVGAFFLFHSKQKDEYVEDCHAAHDQDRDLEQSGVGKMALIFFNDEKQKDSE